MGALAPHLGPLVMPPKGGADLIPLNFVNNFAGLSVELLDELKETAAPTIAGLAEDERADVDEIVAMLTGNLEKIAEHGRRADGIVMSMLEHFARGKRRAPRGRPQPPGPKRRSTSPITARARPEVQHHAGTRFRRGHRPDRIGAAGT
jgi:hypothetical protein